MQDEKYAVFKMEEFSKAWEECFPQETAMRSFAYAQFAKALVNDAVVIRRQDEFAPPALDAYASAIRTAVEGAQGLLKAIPMPLRSQVAAVLEERVARLIAIADYFHEQAAEAWNTLRKLPD